jgi:phage tail sheath protein FI
MPEYLAPGVYVEETSFRSKSIEGVSTTTTGFIGPTRYGPTDLEPEIITSLGEFERTYGDRQQLLFADTEPMHNWMWHAVRAFFEEGGQRLYVARVFRRDPNDAAAGLARAILPDQSPPVVPDGQTIEQVAPDALHFRARFPGKPGEASVHLTLQLGQNVLGVQSGAATIASLRSQDLVLISDLTSPVGSPPGTGTFYIANQIVDPVTKATTWVFDNSGVGTLGIDALTPSSDPKNPGDSIRVLTLALTVDPSDENGTTSVWDGLPLDPQHKLGSSPDSVFDYFAVRPPNLDSARTLPIVVTRGDNLQSGLDVLKVLLLAKPSLLTNLLDPNSTQAARSIDLYLQGGNDGVRPTFDEYEGKADPDTTVKTGLKIFEGLDDISIVAAPGSTFGFANGYHDDANTIAHLLIAHAENMHYRIAVLDSGDGQSISEVRNMRATFDSSYAAFYYPWIRILDPVTRQEIHIPPSGSVAGIYARNDIERAVYKAPANEVVNVAIGFEHLLNKAQQEVLNPEGINCFRFFEDRGFRLWGARTISSDPEWKYVNLRRYFAYLEHSIDKGTQWAVFEPNGEALWANVRRTIANFLLNEWQSGALLGDKPEKAYFVKCDRSTMTQNDLDNGRLVALVGVAALRPAEFVIFRIGQWTADSSA